MLENKFVTLGKLKTLNKTILVPENAGLRLILSCCNMSGHAESPLINLLDKKWGKVKAEVKGWFATRQGFTLGNVNATAVQSDTWVVHMLCQNNKEEVDAKALNNCLKKALEMARYEKATIHVSSLLLEQLPSLKDLLETTFVSNGISVCVYNEPVTTV